MDILEKFLKENAWRFPKGYPEISRPEDRELLFKIVEELILEDEDTKTTQGEEEKTDKQSEKLGSTKKFNDAIEKHLGVSPPPTPKGNYTIEAGPFEVDPADRKTFLDLYKVSPDKGVGNGEVSLYWLFSPNAKESHGGEGGSSADLILNGIPVEVKSYPSHTSKITLGKFSSDKDARTKITRVFGIANLLGIQKLVGKGKKAETQDFISEVAFNTNDVYEAYLKAIQLKQGLAQLSSDLKDEGSVFGLVEKQLDTVIPSGMAGSPTEQAEMLTKALLIDFLVTKIGKKPGEQGGFVANVSSKNPLSIVFFNIPDVTNLTNKLKDKSLKQLSDLISVSSGEIGINYNLLQD